MNVFVSGDCSELKEVYLVINGYDLKGRVKLTPDKVEGDCHWYVNLGDASISTSVARFSLRAGPARSGCQKARPNEGTKPPSASLEFSCCVKGPSRNVSVKINPPMPVSYILDVPPLDGDNVQGIRCLEFATFTTGQGAINAHLGGEDVSLQLGAPIPKPKTPGLLLNRIVANDGKRVLSLNGMSFQLTVQRAQGKMRSAPGFSSNAITLDIKQLEALKFEQAEFEVIK